MTETKTVHVELIPVTTISPSLYQARKVFDPEALQSLADSMAHEGQLQPVVVRQVTSHKSQVTGVDSANESSPNLLLDTWNLKYELVSGERRWRAAQMLGWETIEAKIISTVSEAEAAAKGLIENIQREQLNPIEEAQGFAELLKLDTTYWTQEQIAKTIGRTQAYISQSLKLLELPESIRQNISRLILSRSHGLELLRLPTPELQLQVAEMIPGRLTREETREVINALLEKGQATKTLKHPDPLAPLWKKVKEELQADSHSQWKVHYKGDLQWNFQAKLDPSTSMEADKKLGQFFLRLGHLLGAAE